MTREEALTKLRERIDRGWETEGHCPCAAGPIKPVRRAHQRRSRSCHNTITHASVYESVGREATYVMLSCHIHICRNPDAVVVRLTRLQREEAYKNNDARLAAQAIMA